ncbi:MAG TPA: SDR family oxidoreductase [Ktedonobacterales bacterium]
MSGEESLRGKIALITGASSGIGEAIAEDLAAHGMRLALAARRTDRLDALSRRLAEAHGAEAVAIACDVREPAQVEAAVAAALRRFGAIDVLVANAGFGYRAPVVDGDVARWKSLLDTNVFGLLVTLKYGVKPMLERGSGHVIVTSSVAGRVVTAGGGVYCGSKFAATAIAEALRMEAGPKGVRVTTIEPGVVISEFQAVAEYTPEIVQNMLKGTTPLMPADIARAVTFALEQPTHVALNEIVVRATGQAYP